mgnify:FL=1
MEKADGYEALIGNQENRTAYDEEKDHSNHIIVYGAVKEECDSLCGKLCLFPVYFSDSVFDAAVCDHSVCASYKGGLHASGD